MRTAGKLKKTLEDKIDLAGNEKRKTQAIFKIIGDASKVIGTATERVNDILTHLKQFVQLDEAEFQATDLHEGIESALSLLKHQLGEGIAVVCEFGTLPSVHCSPGQLNQVLMHLIKNAAQALNGKGEILIRTFAEDDQVCIEVIDDGPGMPPEQVAQVFEVGFDKKSGRVEMRLGLAMDYNIIRQNNGTMHIESQVGRGTKVEIHLPC